MTAVEKVGDAETPNACPFCGTTVEPVLGALIGRPSVGWEISAEPWREMATCPECGAQLRRIPGDAWTGTRRDEGEPPSAD
jgi:predicted RNA-binding Zn-ribbon protein involved in translation (DUF1610 family)